MKSKDDCTTAMQKEVFPLYKDVDVNKYIDHYFASAFLNCFPGCPFAQLQSIQGWNTISHQLFYKILRNKLSFIEVLIHENKKNKNLNF